MNNHRYLITERGERFLRDWSPRDNDYKHSAKQQILVMCDACRYSGDDDCYGMSKEDIKSDFLLEFPVTTPASKNTRDVFNWALNNIDELIGVLLDDGMIYANVGM